IKSRLPFITFSTAQFLTMMVITAPAIKALLNDWEFAHPNFSKAILTQIINVKFAISKQRISENIRSGIKNSVNFTLFNIR
ncbi:MAG: hypothetical protein ACXVJN_23165, partial [Mucilaginibacter sp.]